MDKDSRSLSFLSEPSFSSASTEFEPMDLVHSQPSQSQSDSPQSLLSPFQSPLQPNPTQPVQQPIPTPNQVVGGLGEPIRDYVLVPIFIHSSNSTYCDFDQHQKILVIKRNEWRSFSTLVRDTFPAMDFSPKNDPSDIWHVLCIDWHIFLGRNDAITRSYEHLALPKPGQRLTWPQSIKVTYDSLISTPTKQDISDYCAGNWTNKLAMWGSYILISSCKRAPSSPDIYGIYGTSLSNSYNDHFDLLTVVKNPSASKASKFESEIARLQVPKEHQKSFTDLLNDLFWKRPLYELRLSESGSWTKSEQFQEVRTKVSNLDALVASDEDIPRRLTSILGDAKDIVQIIENPTQAIGLRLEDGFYKANSSEFAQSSHCFSGQTSPTQFLNAVCKITPNENIEKIGTGFLIKPDLLMTCFHVLFNCNFEELPLDQYLQPVSRTFTYAFTVSEITACFSIDDVIFPQNKFERQRIGLDIAIVKLQNPIGQNPLISFSFSHSSQNWLKVESKQQEKQSLYLLGWNDKTDVKDTEVIGFRNWEVLYTHNTRPGDSGAPLVNSAGHLMAIHRRAGGLSTRGSPLCNIGVRVDLVLRDLFRADLLGKKDYEITHKLLKFVDDGDAFSDEQRSEFLKLISDQ